MTTQQKEIKLLRNQKKNVGEGTERVENNIHNFYKEKKHMDKPDHAKHEDKLRQDEDEEMKLTSVTPEEPCTSKKRGELFSFPRIGRLKIP